VAAMDQGLCDHPLYNQPVVVKNTFLDFDESSQAPAELRRVQTEPPPNRDYDDSSSEGAADVQTPEAFERELTGELTYPSQPPGVEENTSQEPQSPEPEIKSRVLMVESMEPSSYWSWGMSADREAAGPAKAPSPASPPTPTAQTTPGTPVAAMPKSQPVAQAPGFIMVPSTVVLSGVPAQRPPVENPPACPPGWVSLPIDRRARWPAGIPMVAGGGMPPAPPPAQAPPILQRVKSPDEPPALAPGGGEVLEASQPSSQPRAQVEPSGGGQPVLQRAFSVRTSTFRVNWTVTERKLRSKDQLAVSPEFELSFGTAAKFRMVIHPTETSDLKGGKSFTAAKGKGKVELKCQTDLKGNEATMTYRICVGSLPPRGPVTHNFAEKNVSGLKEEEEEWDFAQAVTEADHTFVVCLEVLPQPKSGGF